MADENYHGHKRCPYDTSVEFHPEITYLEDFKSREVCGTRQQRLCDKHNSTHCLFELHLPSKPENSDGKTSNRGNTNALDQGNALRGAKCTEVPAQQKTIRKLVPKDHPDAGKPIYLD